MMFSAAIRPISVLSDATKDVTSAPTTLMSTEMTATPWLSAWVTVGASASESIGLTRMASTFLCSSVSMLLT